MLTTAASAPARRVTGGVGRNDDIGAALARRTVRAASPIVTPSSPTGLEPVFQEILASATRFCEGDSGCVLLRNAAGFEAAAVSGATPAFADFLRRGPLPAGPDSGLGWVATERIELHLPDLAAEAAYQRHEPDWVAAVELEGARTALHVPMLRGDDLIGIVTMYRRVRRPFAEEQIALARTFAGQAVVASENVRLRQDLQSRDRELAEGLEQQRATSEILRVIASSPTELQPVLDAVAENAARVCGATDAVIMRIQGDALKLLAHYGPIPSVLEAGNSLLPMRGSVVGQAVLERKTVQVADLAATANTEYPLTKELGRRHGVRTVLATPLIREGVPIGVIGIRRLEVQPFSDKQIELLRTFADQAVIAIENVRLFNETKEALEQQTATAEILKVISGSPTDVQPVFETIVRNAVSLCGSRFANVFRFDGELLHYTASHNVGQSYVELLRTKYPLRPDFSQVSGRVLLTNSIVRMEDALADPDYDQQFPRAMGLRRVLGVPMQREGNPLGAIVVGWAEAGPVPKVQEELLKTFADQAVIAIENVRLFQALQAKNRDLTEALEQQTATSEVLQVISSSPTDATPVFETIVASAARLCEAKFAAALLYDGERLHSPAHTTVTAEFAEYFKKGFPVNRQTTAGRAALERKPVQIDDILSDSEFSMTSAHRSEGVRTVLAVPMLRDEVLLGIITTWRVEVRPFTDQQIKLLQTFADQAVIAIENVRLFNELQARNRDLTEALEQQTATAEILRVISTSPTDLQPVLDTVVKSAARFCGASDAEIFHLDGGHLKASAHYGPIPGPQGRLIPIGRGSLAGRAVLERRNVHVADLQAEAEEFPVGSSLAREFGYRTALAVPLLREWAAVGTINLRRTEVNPFTDKQIAVLQTFADQAVIAIENVRLFQELGARNRELTEALEQQTATAEILRVISSSPTDVQPVFETIVRNAVSLCGSLFANVFRFDGELLHFVASHDVGLSYVELIESKYPTRPDSSHVSGRVLLTRSVVRLEDALADPDYDQQFSRAMGLRRILGVPMLREGVPLGAIVVGWGEAGPIPKVQEELLKTFADQAAIAIENVRLLQELQGRNRDLTEALEQQTATAEILRVISSSPTDVQPVLDAVASTAARLCGASDALIFRRDGDLLQLVAKYGTLSPGDIGRGLPLNRSTVGGRCVVDRETVHVHDLAAADESEFALGRDLARRLGYRTTLGTPLMREGQAIGAITIRRPEVRPFGDNQIKLLQTFADQASIAIENVRLFQELQAKNRELTKALEQQTATAEILRVISSSPIDVRPVFETIARNAVALCGGLFSAVFRYDGELMHFVAEHNLVPEALEVLRTRYPKPPDASLVAARAVLDRKVVRIEDTLSDPDYDHRFSAAGGWRRNLGVPMLRDGKPLGSISVAWAEPGPIPKDQEDLLKTFADQAVIAIENVRLFNEIKEALDQQKASAEVLQVISSSVADTKPVFDKILESCARLFGGLNVGIGLVGADGAVHLAAYQGPNREDLERHFPVPLSDDSGSGAAILQRRVVHYPDIEGGVNVPAYARRGGEIMGLRSIIFAPMLWEGRSIGSIWVGRGAVGEFSEKEIGLLKTFADQAVIAIQNARLFNELQARTRELARSVEELRALGEVGRAVSSTLELDTVLTTIIARALELSGADGGVIVEYDEATQLFNLRTTYRVEEEMVDVLRAAPIRLGEGITGKAAATRAPVQVADVLEEGAYDVARFRNVNARVGYRSALSVPLLREDGILGALTVLRRQVGLFPPEVVNLLQTFATQSTLAIQNARLFREIEEKGRELELASRHKSEFLANMSHELRTPLNAVLGYTELILDSIYGEVPEKIRDVMTRIDKSGRHLLGLINDVLDLSKIEAGQLTLSLADYSMKELVQTVLVAVESLAAEKRLALKVDVGADLPRGRGDERRLSQVLLNLVGNALKFTAAGGVRVEAGLRNGEFVVSVADTGPGISPADQERIFEAFQQVDSSVTRKKGGTGLGLSIARRIVELHGGRLWVESAPGTGSTFSFAVPVRVERQVTA